MEATKSKMPLVVWLLIALFGGGGIFYAANDYYEKHKQAKAAQTKGYEGGPSLSSVSVDAAFLPPVAVSLPTSAFVRVRNDSQQWSVPNVTVVMDAGSSKIENCEVRTGSAKATLSDKNGGGIYTFALDQLPPQEDVGVYCLGSDFRNVAVNLTARDSLGNVVGSRKSDFVRAQQKLQQEASGSGFFDFLQIVAGIVILAVAGCIIVLIFGLFGKLFKAIGVLQS